MLRTHSKSRRRSKPCFESLETRQCLAAGGIVVQNHVLIINGDDTANTIMISDDGHGNVDASISLAGETNVHASASEIRGIVVNGRAGADQLNYTLTNALSQPENISVNMAGGDDIVTMNLAAGIGSAPVVTPSAAAAVVSPRPTPAPTPRLNLEIATGDGADHVGLNLGDVTDGRANIEVNLGGGDDTFEGLLGNLVGKSEVHVDVDGGQGADNISLKALSSLAVDSALQLELGGGGGDDHVSLGYEGVLNGKLGAVVDGDAGNDTVLANIVVQSGSTGKLRAGVFGGRGDDDETFNFIDNSGGAGNPSTLAAANAVIGNLVGTNTLTYTPNVTVLNPPPPPAV